MYDYIKCTSMGYGAVWITMANVVAVLALMVFLAVFVEGRDWRFDPMKRVKRGYNSGFGSDGTFGRSDEQNASVSRERLNLCSGEGYSGSHELGYNKDGRMNENENNRGHRSFSKASASASASAGNQNHKAF